MREQAAEKKEYTTAQKIHEAITNPELAVSNLEILEKQAVGAHDYVAAGIFSSFMKTAKGI